MSHVAFYISLPGPKCYESYGMTQLSKSVEMMMWSKEADIEKWSKMGYFELSRFSVGQFFGVPNISETQFRISKVTFVGMKILVP